KFVAAIGAASPVIITSFWCAVFSTRGTVCTCHNFEYMLIVLLSDYVSNLFLSVKILIFYGNFQKSISKFAKKKKPISL
uniref:hypothetical protein n=1 Tax=Flavobacterium sp. TaxID=239 RepID=UPI004049331F